MKVADGDAYQVPHADYIFLPPRASPKRTYVIVHGDAGFALERGLSRRGVDSAGVAAD